jgi:hypothetical protein
MSDHHQRPGRPPTAKQQAYLRRLALARGISFTPPRTITEASRLIDELQRRRPDSTADQRRERKQVRVDLDNNSGGATRVRDAELDGYGSTATWKRA